MPWLAAAPLRLPRRRARRRSRVAGPLRCAVEAGNPPRPAVNGPPGPVLDALAPDRRTQYDKRLAEIDAKWPPARAAVKDFVDHIDYLVKLIGVDHVGISSDFDGGGGIEGWNSAAETFNVTLELVRRGYTEGADCQDLERQPPARVG